MGAKILEEKKRKRVANLNKEEMRDRSEYFVGRKIGSQ